MDNLKVQGIISEYRNKAIMTTQIKVKDVLKHYEIDLSVNRELGYHRLPKIVNYIDTFDSECGIFLPSLVFSFREDPNPYWDNNTSIFTIPSTLKLIVLDGQHRIKGLERYIDRKKVTLENKKRIEDSYLTAQVYFGLSKDEERKLFTDINTNAKRVSRSLITKFDNRDILNVLTRQVYNSSKVLQSVLTIEFEKSRIGRPNKTTFITSVRFKKFLKIIFFGEGGIGANPPNLNKREEKLVRENYDEIFSFLNKLFQSLAEALPSNPGNVREYVLGHEPIQSSIALYIHENIITECQTTIEWIVDWEEVIDNIGLVNWSVKNREWKPYMFVSREGTKNEHMAFYDSYSFTNELKGIIEKKS